MQFCGNGCGWYEILAGTGGDEIEVLRGLVGWNRNWTQMGRDGNDICVDGWGWM